MGANLAERRESTNQALTKTKSNIELCGLEKEFLSSPDFSHSRSSNALQCLESSMTKVPSILAPVTEKEISLPNLGKSERRWMTLPKSDNMQCQDSSTTEMPSRLAPVAEKEAEGVLPSLGKSDRRWTTRPKTDNKKIMTADNKNRAKVQPSQAQKTREVLFIEAEYALRKMAGQVPSPETATPHCVNDQKETKQSRKESFKSKKVPTPSNQRHVQPPPKLVPDKPTSAAPLTRVPPVLELARRRSSGMTIQYPSIIGRPCLEVAEQTKVGPRSLVDQLLGQFKGMQSFSFTELRTTKGKDTQTNSAVSKPVFQFRKGRPINSGAVLEIAKKFMGFE